MLIRLSKTAFITFTAIYILARIFVQGNTINNSGIKFTVTRSFIFQFLRYYIQNDFRNTLTPIHIWFRRSWFAWYHFVGIAAFFWILNNSWIAFGHFLGSSFGWFSLGEVDVGLHIQNIPIYIMKLNITAMCCVLNNIYVSKLGE